MKSGPAPYYSSIAEVIKKSISINGDDIDFLNSDYQNTSSLLQMRCKVHDLKFQNTVYHVLRGAGCRECRLEKIHRAADKKRVGIEKFINRSNLIHMGRYDYSLVKYKSLTDSVEIICPDHGIFLQKPREHFRGNGCSLCAATSVSAIGFEWLLSLSIENLDIEHRINYNDKWYFVDGFDSKTNTVYEFYGDYWHGNPNTTDHDKMNLQAGKTFGELYNNTMVRETNIRNLGYNFISIWESEYNDKTPI